MDKPKHKIMNDFKKCEKCHDWHWSEKDCLPGYDKPKHKIMNDFKKCEKCHDWHWSEKDCLPGYEVFFEEYMGDESKKYHAVNHEDAAEKFAQYYNTQNDYCLMNESIVVRVVKDGIEKNVLVSAGPDVHYSSKIVD